MHASPERKVLCLLFLIIIIIIAVTVILIFQREKLFLLLLHFFRSHNPSNQLQFCTSLFFPFLLIVAELLLHFSPLASRRFFGLTSSTQHSFAEQRVLLALCQIRTNENGKRQSESNDLFFVCYACTLQSKIRVKCAAFFYLFLLFPLFRSALQTFIWDLNLFVALLMFCAVQQT